MTTDNTDDALPSGIGAPATRALTAAGLTCLSQLADVTENHVAALHGVGPKAVRILKEQLAVTGRSFLPSAK